MDIKKGTKLKIYHKRHGVFLGIAERDFNTEKDEFYPITLDQEDLYGANTHWQIHIGKNGIVCLVGIHYAK